MKKIIFSILFMGVATYANAQKSEVAEAKRLWGIFQFSMSQDPNAPKISAPKKRIQAGPASTGGFGVDGKGDTKVGKTIAARGSAPRPTGEAPKLSFVDKQIVSLKEGLVHVNKALEHEKTKNLAESWLYKALFSSAIAYVDTLNMDNSLKYQKDAEEAIEKTLALDTKGEFKEDLSVAQVNIRNTMVGRGLRAYNDKDYNTSYNYFIDVLKRNPQDTSMYLNAGVIAKLAGKYQESVQNFKKLVNFNVPESKNYYLEMINITLEQLKDTTSALALISEASAKFPDDPQLIGTETDIYILRGDIAKSQASLQKLIAKEPNKSLYQYLMGETYYKQALGMQEVRNKIDLKSTDPKKKKENEKEYDAISAKMMVLIDQSLPFYKKSHELDPKFVAPLESLKQIYGFKNDTANFTDVKKKLDALPQN
ncbi:tetratricopeptide repeat protein [Pedobacter sp. Du54]|uniref:tetratricopeptide repeat protein n=1 Tax=Pedobacter anseongensis TaxID=3133439 RepID=UPI00309924A9